MFVNVTAAWCITCLVNERVALGTRAVTDAFARKGVVAAARPTGPGAIPSSRRCSARSDATACPLYLLYPGGGGAREPTVLPQILSEGIVLSDRSTKEKI